MIRLTLPSGHPTARSSFTRFIFIDHYYIRIPLTNCILLGWQLIFNFVKNEMMTKQERMYRLIERQQASGQTMKSFCEQEQCAIFHGSICASFVS